MKSGNVHEISSQGSGQQWMVTVVDVCRWEGIQAIRVRDGALGLSHFKLLKRLGCGDIGSVYLAELRGSHSHFAMKVMVRFASYGCGRYGVVTFATSVLGIRDGVHCAGVVGVEQSVVQ